MGRRGRQIATTISLFNSLTKKVESLTSIAPGQVGIYACGPTVYDNQHIGNFRTYLMVDTLRRSLEALGQQVKLVINITDVGHLTSDQDEGEDKIEKGAAREHKTAFEIAKYYEERFLSDLGALNIVPPAVMPRATEHIPEMIELIQKIETNGLAYTIDDGVYFDTAKDPSYGQMAGLNLGGQEAGARVAVNSQKRSPFDFALWKLTPPGVSRQMEWDSPWGKGFPGWHIECSAMSVKYLGQPFDIHTGGVDHIPVHHTNEIAQTKAATGLPLANVFVHFEHLLVDGRKMSKSDGTFITVEDIEKRGVSPRAFRYLCLSAHYREKLNFTWESLKAASSGLERIDRLVKEAGTPDEESKEKALELVGQDLATPKLLAFLETQNNPWLWRELDSVLGLQLSQKKEGIELTLAQSNLVKKREHARQSGNYKQADQLREELLKEGIVVEDTSGGTRLTRLI